MSRITDLIDKINEMSYNRKKALNLLDSLQSEIAMHLFLVSQYPENTNVQHWLSELRTWQGKLVLYDKAPKPMKKNYSEKMLWHAIWEEPLGATEDRSTMASVIHNTKHLPQVDDIDVEALGDLAMQFVQGVLTKTYLRKS